MNKLSDQYRFSLRQLLLWTFVVCAALAIGVNLPHLLTTAYDNWKVGSRYDRISYQEPKFDLRVTALTERGTVFAKPSVFYRYEVSKPSGSRWHTIAQVRVPSKKPIPRNQFKSVSADCSFFFNDRFVGITVNGGKDWHCIDIDSLPLSSPPAGSYLKIDSLDIRASGAGDMVVSSIDPSSGRESRFATLQTNDFGGSWERKRGGTAL